MIYRLLAAATAIAVACILVPGCDRTSDRNASVTAGFRLDPAAFDQDLALRETESLIALGPRDAGTEGAQRAAHHLRDRFAAFGCQVEIDAFTEPTPRGDRTFRNIVARVQGQGEGSILIGSHYDTKSGISSSFVGANDSGSSTGTLLELARIAAAAAAINTPTRDLVFVAFDGEECMVSYGPNDGFHGSRHAAQSWLRSGKAESLQAVIVLDMIGDPDLTVTIPRNSTRELVSLAFEAAREEGARERFFLWPNSIGDDHVAFLDIGVPAIDLIDFEFGSAPGKNDYWHTDADTMEQVSADSLGTIGRVTVRMVNRLLDVPAFPHP